MLDLDTARMLQSTFYRVSVKAIVKDADDRLLLFMNKRGNWEVPGGGWEHDENLDDCLRREIMEEMQVDVAEIGPVAFVYTSKQENGIVKMCVAVPTVLASHDFVPTADDLVEARFVSKEEIRGLQWHNEAGILDCIDKIWPPTTTGS